MGHAQADDLVSRSFCNVLTVKENTACFRGQQSGDGVQRGGLARAVGTDQSNDLPLIYLEGNPFNGLDHTVVDFHIL